MNESLALSMVFLERKLGNVCCFVVKGNLTVGLLCVVFVVISSLLFNYLRKETSCYLKNDLFSRVM